MKHENENINPFAEYLPAKTPAERPSTPVTLDDVTEKALDLVRTVSWCNDNPDGAPTYVQNRLTMTEATTMVGSCCDIEDADSVRKCISAYFEMCKLNSTDPTLPGLANAMGKSTTWLKGLKDVGTDAFFTRKPLLPEVKDAIFQALRVLDQLFAQAVFDGRISPAAANQIGMNHFDYVNKVEHKVDITSRLETPKSIEEIQREFDALPVLDVEFEEIE